MSAFLDLAIFQFSSFFLDGAPEGTKYPIIVIREQTINLLTNDY